MASVFKRKNSKYWQCTFTSVDGRRVYRSTGKIRKGKARDVAAELDPSAQQEQRALLAVIEESTALALKGKLTLDAARDMLDWLMRLSGAEAGLEIPTVKEWLSSWASGQKQTKKAGTAQRYKGIVDGFLNFLDPTKHDAPLHALTPGDFMRYRNRQKAEGFSPSTINLTLKVLRAPLSRAAKFGYIQTSPASAVDTLPQSPSRKEAFTREQVSALTEACRIFIKASRTERERRLYRDWEAAVLLAYYTGQRQSDIANLQWDSVDLEAETITFNQIKSDKRVTIPLHPEVLAKLRFLPRENVNVLPTLAGKTSSRRNGLSGMFAGLMKEAMTEPKTAKAQGKGHSQNSLTFHSLRHAFNSHLADLGVPQELRKSLTGHASTKVNDIYTHLGLATLREAVQKLECV